MRDTIGTKVLQVFCWNFRHSCKETLTRWTQPILWWRTGARL